MRACTYVGRVGGLAVALGVGAAVFGGTAVGWADDTSTGSSVDRTSTQARGQAPHSSSTSTAPGGRGTRGAGVSAVQTERPSNDAPAVVIPDALLDKVIPQTPAADPEPVTEVAPAEAVAAPAAEPIAVPASAPSVVSATPLAVTPAPAVELAPVDQNPAEPVAAPAAAVAAVPTGTVTALDDPLAGTGPGGVPVDTPLDWTVLAYTRRSPLPAASVAAPAAPATPTLPIIMGPSGVPIPSEAYGTTVMSYYLPYEIPGTEQLLFTPEGLYPITGVKSLPFNTSVDQGIRILNNTLSELPAGTPVTVFGYSQSAVIASLLQGGYTVDVDGTQTKLGVPTDVQNSINFVLVGNEMNPDGGFLSRFSGRNMPMFSLEALGIDFYGATPGAPIPATGVEYPTTNYMREYDGFSDFPRYPINFLSALNAGLGIVYVHTQYAPVSSPEKCAKTAFCLTPEQLAQKQLLPSSKPLTQNYYIIPTQNLPLLQPLRAIPFIGNPIADLLQPALKVIVNFGYADKAHGFTTATQPFANELQPFEFLPPANVYAEAFQQFVAGIGQGIKDFIADFGPNGSIAREIAAYSAPTLGPVAFGAADGFISTVQNVINSVTNWVSGTAANLYAALLPTADIVNSFLTSLPGYATNLFLYGIQEVLNGDIIKGLSDAVGLPIAATVGLSSTALLVGALVWGQAIAPNLGS